MNKIALSVASGGLLLVGLSFVVATFVRKYSAIESPVIAGEPPQKVTSRPILPKEIEIQSNEGRTIKGYVVDLNNSMVEFLRSDGETFDIPIGSITEESLKLINLNWLYRVKNGKIKAPKFTARPVNYLFDTFKHLGMETKGWRSRGDDGRYSAVFDIFRYGSGNEDLEFYCSGQKDMVTDMKLSMDVKGTYRADEFTVEHYIEMCERLYSVAVGGALPEKAKKALLDQDNVILEIPGASVYVTYKNFERGTGFTQSILIRLPISAVELRL